MSLHDIQTSGASLRLCELFPNEVCEDGNNRHALGVPIGTAIHGAWNPSAPDELIVLFSSGVIRVWNSLRDTAMDLTLFLPTAGLNGAVPVSARRSAAPIARFAPLPASAARAAGADTSRGAICFSLARSRTVYVVALPAPLTSYNPDLRTKDAISDRFTLGARVWEAVSPPNLMTTTAAPSRRGVVTALVAWEMISGVNGNDVPLTCIAAGCDTGGIEIWAIGQSLNPAPSPIGTSRPPTGPRLAWVGIESNAHHTTRVRGFTPLLFNQHSAIIPIATTNNNNNSGGSGGGTTDAAENAFVSLGDDGRACVWLITRTGISSSNNNLSASTTGWAAGSVALTLVPLCAVPADGSTLTTAASVPWPWSHSASVREPLLSSLGTIGATRWTSSSSSSSVIGNAAATISSGPLSRAGARSLLATATADGVIALWEILVPAKARSLRSAWTGPPIGAGFVDGLQVPSVRLAGVGNAGAREPIISIALSQGIRGFPAALAASAGDGSLSVWHLSGLGGNEIALAESPASTLAAALSPGGAPPLVLALRGRIGPIESEINNSSTTSSLDVIRSLGTNVNIGDALATAALANLRRTVVTVGFNFAIANAVNEQHADNDENGDDDSCRLAGALFALSGDGGVRLWERAALPGIHLEEVDNDVDIADDDEITNKNNDEVSDEHVAAAEEGRDVINNIVYTSSMILPLSSNTPAVVGTTSDTSVTNKNNDDDDDDNTIPRTAAPPQPSTTIPSIPLSLPRALDATVSSRAKKLEKRSENSTTQKQRLVGRGGGGGFDVKLMEAATAAVERAYAIESTTNGATATGPNNVPTAAPSSTRALSAERFCRDMTTIQRVRLVEETENSGDRDGNVGGGSGSGGNVSSSRHSINGPAVPRIDSRNEGWTAPDATWNIAKFGASASGGGSEEGADPGEVSIGGNGGGGGGEATVASSQVRAITPNLSTTGLRPAGDSPLRSATPPAPFLARRFRSPARVASAVARDAALTARASALAAKENTGSPDWAVDESPDAADAWARERAGASARLAPTLASTAALALEVRRLEATEFDVSAAVARALVRRGVTDACVKARVLAREKRDQREMVAPSSASLPLPLPRGRSSSRHHARNSPEGGDPIEPASANASVNLSVNASDMLAWRSQLRGRNQIPRAPEGCIDYVPSIDHGHGGGGGDGNINATSHQQQQQQHHSSRAPLNPVASTLPTPALRYGSSASFGNTSVDIHAADLGTVIFSPVHRSTPSMQ